ncbi:MAG: hypothetical protein AAGB46_13010 [Verrucomicrobiota bacterium]
MKSASYCTLRNNVFVDVSGAARLDDHSLGTHDYVSQWNDIFAFFSDFVGTPYETAYSHLTTFWSDWATYTDLPRDSRLENNLIFDGDGSLIQSSGYVDDFSATASPLSVSGNFVTTSDPGFSDYANQDFSLVAGGAVFTQIPGFPDIAFSEIGLQGPVGPNADSEAAVIDDFDADSTGSDPAGYTVLESGGSAEIVGVPSATNKSLMLQDTHTSQSVKVVKEFEPQSAPIVWEFAIRPEENKPSYLSLLSDSGSYAIQLWTSASGKIGYKAGGSYYDTTTAFSTVVFQTLRVELDFNSKEYSVFLNGTLALADQAFLNTGATDLSQLEFNTGGGSTGVYYYDNVKVSR